MSHRVGRTAPLEGSAAAPPGVPAVRDIVALLFLSLLGLVAIGSGVCAVLGSFMDGAYTYVVVGGSVAVLSTAAFIALAGLLFRRSPGSPDDGPR